MNVLDLGKAEVPSLRDRTGRVGAGVASEGNRGVSACVDRIGIEVGGKPRKPGFATIVAALLDGGHVSGKGVDRLDGGDAMPLSHEPGARRRGDRVGDEIADECGNHVERAAGMSLRCGLEGLRRQRRAGEVHPSGIGHVDDGPHGGRREAVRCREQAVIRIHFGRSAGRDQPRPQGPDAIPGFGRVLDDAVAIGPTQKFGRWVVVHSLDLSARIALRREERLLLRWRIPGPKPHRGALSE